MIGVDGTAAARRRRGAVALASTVLAVSTSACYSTRALLGPPDPGTQVQVRLNDRGRLALADSLGRDPDLVDGRVTARTDSSFTLAVSRVHLFSGDATTWRGEPVTLRTSSVRGLESRRLERGLTTALVVGSVAALVLLLRTLSIGGGGSGAVPGGPTPPPPSGT